MKLRMPKLKKHNQEVNSKRKWRFKATVTIFVLFVVAGIILLVVRNLNAPAVGSISQAPVKEAATVDPYAQPGSYSGKYIRFSYPEHFKKVLTQLSGSYLEVVGLYSTQQTGKQISIGVLPGNLSDSGAITYRQEHPELYTRLTSKIGLEFTKKDGTEDTFFIQHGSNLASVSATAPYQGLNGEALFVASSLRWN